MTASEPEQSRKSRTVPGHHAETGGVGAGQRHPGKGGTFVIMNHENHDIAIDILTLF